MNDPASAGGSQYGTAGGSVEIKRVSSASSEESAAPPLSAISIKQSPSPRHDRSVSTIFHLHFLFLLRLQFDRPVTAKVSFIEVRFYKQKSRRSLMGRCHHHSVSPVPTPNTLSVQVPHVKAASIQGQSLPNLLSIAVPVPSSASMLTPALVGANPSGMGTL